MCTGPAGEPAAATSRYVRLGGLRAHYLEWGEAGAPAVLLLHGLRSYAATWEPLARHLSRRHRVLALDFRGRGESAWDPERRYVTPSYVSDVEEWVALLGLRRFTLVGHSMGGTVGYVYAARHPGQVARLVVEDIGPGSSTATSGADRVRRELASTPESFESREAALAYWRAVRPGMPEPAIRSRVEHTLRRDGDGRWTWKLDLAGIAHARLSGDPSAGIDLWQCVAVLRCPTLVVRGERSDFLPERTCVELAARQPLLRWVSITGAGHYAHDDNPREFETAVSHFLREPAP